MMIANIPLQSRDWYCGQCGCKHLKGTPVERCPCTKGRIVTEVRYCVFCGQPRVNTSVYVRHTCGTHTLRDYWAMGQPAPVPPPGKPKAQNQAQYAEQGSLFGNEVNV